MNRRKFLLGVVRGVIAAAVVPLVAILPRVGGPGEVSVTMRQIMRAKQILDDQGVVAARYVLLTNEQITELFGPLPAAPPWRSWSWEKLAEVNPRIEGFEIIPADARGTGTVAAWAGDCNVFVDCDGQDGDVWIEGDPAALVTGYWLKGPRDA